MPTNVEIWSDYAKDRFESAAKRVDEFRNWARQLGTAVAVLIGLEFTLLGRALDPAAPFSARLRDAFLMVFVVAVVIQVFVLFGLLRTGYVGRTILGPESPVTLWRYLEGKNSDETRWMLGAYYANAHDQFHALSQELGRKVGVATRFLAASIVLFFLAVLLLVCAFIIPSAMSEPANEPAAPQTPSGPSQPSGQNPPLESQPLPTPTAGLPTTAGDSAPLPTPTRGMDLTAGHNTPLPTPTRGLDMTRTLFPLTPKKE